VANILVVDDDAANRLLLTTILEHHAHAVVECADGASASAALDRRRPDLIIADMQMPGVDGLEFIRLLREDARHDRVAILLHTATAEDDALHNLVRAYRIDGILPKPSEPDQVLRAVEAALARLSERA